MFNGLLDKEHSNKILKLRGDFPPLIETMGGGKPIYFDNACMTLKPKQVINAMTEYYFKHPSCHNRAVHKFGKATSREYSEARKTVQRFINAKDPSEIIFTKNATEGINIIANSFCFKKGGSVLTTDAEHNSNFLPWQMLNKNKGIEHIIFPLEHDFSFDMNKFKAALAETTEIVSIFHTSHVTGCSLPVEEIIRTAHNNGSLVLIDAAQSVSHQPIDVQKMDVDFLVFSFHKMLGPTGMGCFYAKKELLEKMVPAFIGGETVEDVDYGSHKLSKIPERFEAGLQNYAGAVGVNAAVQYLLNVGLKYIAQQISSLNEFITAEISKIPSVTIVGPQDSNLRSGIINFYLKDIDSGELSIILDEAHNIMTRSGVHCCHAWYRKRKIPPSLRASLYFYNTVAEAEIFVDTIKKISTHY